MLYGVLYWELGWTQPGRAEPLSKRTDSYLGPESSGTEECHLDRWGETSQVIAIRSYPVPAIAMGIGRNSSFSLYLKIQALVPILWYTSVLERVIRSSKLIQTINLLYYEERKSLKCIHTKSSGVIYRYPDRSLNPAWQPHTSASHRFNF